MLNIDKKLFNPLYWHLKDAMKNTDIRIIFLIGGSSSSKSYTSSQAICTTSLEEGSNTLMMRKYSVDIDDTIYTDMKTFGEKLNRFTNNFNFIKHQIKIGQSKVKFKGLDKSERIKGISQFKRLYLDEITEFTKDDYDQIRKRLRGQDGQQIIASWNPIHPSIWIKKDVTDKEIWYDLPMTLNDDPLTEIKEPGFKKINAKGNILLIKTTYRDNYWVIGHPAGKKYGFYDKHTIDDFEYDKEHNPVNYKIYANGEYGVDTQGLFFVEKGLGNNEDGNFQTYEIIDREKIPETAKNVVKGLDLGYDPDPSALVDIFYDKTTNNLYLDELFYLQKLANIDPNGNKDNEMTVSYHLRKHGVGEDDIIVCDTEKKSIIELKMDGFIVMPAIKGPGSIMNGIKKMGSFNLFVTSRSKNLLSELQGYRKLKDPITNMYLPKPDPKVRAKHLIDASRYGIYSQGNYW